MIIAKVECIEELRNLVDAVDIVVQAPLLVWRDGWFDLHAEGLEVAVDYVHVMHDIHASCNSNGGVKQLRLCKSATFL